MELEEDKTSHQEEVPDKFICPITQEIMVDPVVSRYGQSYERCAIVDWLASGTKACPLSRRPLTLSGLISNHRLRSEIRSWQIRNEGDVVLVMKPSTDREVCAFMTFEGQDETDRTSDDEGDENQVDLVVRRVIDADAEQRSTRSTAPTRQSRFFRLFRSSRNNINP